MLLRLMPAFTCVFYAAFCHVCPESMPTQQNSHIRLAAAGMIRLALSLPRVEAVDLRPWVPPEHALVISSEHTNPDGSYRAAQQAKNVAWPPPSNSPAHLMKPSFLTVEFSAQQSLSRQKVKHACCCLPRWQITEHCCAWDFSLAPGV